MTSVYKRTKVTETHEWVVPADGPWGACWNEVQLALDQAREHWITAHPNEVRIAAQDDRCVSVPDSAVRVKVADDEIIVFWEGEVKDGPRITGRTFTASANPTVRLVQSDQHLPFTPTTELDRD